MGHVLNPRFSTLEERLKVILEALQTYYEGDEDAFRSDCEYHAVGNSDKERMRSQYIWALSQLAACAELDDEVTA